MPVTFWDRYAANGYDAIRVLLPYIALQRSMLDTLDLLPGEHVMVAGCGTGNLEEMALKTVADIQIDAIDSSSEMLEKARTKCATVVNVRYHQGNLCERLPFSDASFDAVAMCNVLYALQDRTTALVEIRRVIRPGGRFVLCDRLPSSAIWPVWHDHFSALRRLSLKQRIGHLVKTLAAGPTLAGVAMMNGNIQKRHQEGEYYFYSVEEISGLLTEMDFTVGAARVVYGDQCWLLRADLNDKLS